MGIAIVLVLLAVGSVVFHIFSPWWWTPIASNWDYIDDTIIITFWITGVVFVAVVLFMAYCLYRFRYRKGQTAAYQPESKKLEWWLTIVTAVGVAGMLTPGLFVWNQYVTVPEEAHVVEVVGKQWEWSFRLPGKNGVLGTTNTKNVNFENTFGINIDDPNGRDDLLVEGDDLHIPVGRPVKVVLRAIDVLHDFYVPQFRAKMDLVPGMITYYWFTPTKVGEYEVLCAELCGVGHHAMRGKVIVDSEADFEAWLAEQINFDEYMAKYGNGGKKLAAAEEDTDNEE